MTMENQAFIDAYRAPRPVRFKGGLEETNSVRIDETLRELRGAGESISDPTERAEALVDVLEDPSPRLLVRSPRPNAPAPMPEEFEDDRGDEESDEHQENDLLSATRNEAVSLGPVPAFLRKQKEPVVEESPTIRMETLGDLSASAGLSVDIPEEALSQMESRSTETDDGDLADDGLESIPFRMHGAEDADQNDSVPGTETQNEIVSEEEASEDSQSPRGLLPMYQVDHFAWPKACDLFERRAGEQLGTLTKAIEATAFSGTRYLGFASHRKAEGCTTVLASVARRLIQNERRVVLVDADLANPRLAENLGLAVDAGWEKVAAGECGLEDVLIESTGDGELTLLPWCGPTMEAETPLFEDPLDFALFKTLGENYDLVLFDLGAIGTGAHTDSARSPLLHSDCIDSVLIVQDVRATQRDQVLEVKETLEAAGIRPAGITENFVVR